jgi:hypothetical protein
MGEPAVQSEAAVQDCARAPPDDPLEELIEMRYQQYVAQRALEELFENGVLQALEG